jgi:hypothetical protein
MIPTDVETEKGHYIVEAFSDEKRYQRYQSSRIGLNDAGVSLLQLSNVSEIMQGIVSTSRIANFRTDGVWRFRDRWHTSDHDQASP